MTYSSMWCHLSSIDLASVLDCARGHGLSSEDLEDVELIWQLLIEHYSRREVFTWMFFMVPELDNGIPIMMIEDGQSTQVLAQARRMVRDVARD